MDETTDRVSQNPVVGYTYGTKWEIWADAGKAGLSRTGHFIRKQFTLRDLRHMPPWLSYVLLGVAVIVIAYLVYRVIHNQRWYYLFAFTAFVTSFFSAPALKLVVKASGLDKKWNFDVDATWNENSWMINVAAMMVITYFFILENNYQKGLSHEKYFHEFQVVVLDNLRDGIEAKDIAKNRKILLEKVEAIICCMAWLETKPHKKKP